jgi:gliding motility-associated-like protein
LTNGSISANPSGGTGEYIITWDGLPNAGSSISNLVAGVYTINVTDTNGCQISESFVVSEPQPLVLNATSTVAICGANDGTISLTISGGTGPYSTTWSGPTNIPANNLNPTGLTQGVYTANVTDANNCSQTIQIEVEGSDNISVLGNVTNVNCHGEATGGVSIVPENATGTVTVIWFDNQQNQVGSGTEISDLPIGTYNFILTDELGCSAQGTFNVSQPDSLWVEFSVFTYSDGYNVSDYNMSDGSIDVEVGGGVPQYEITWTGPTNIFDGDLNPNNLSAGNYILTVIDQNGCVLDTLIVLTQPDDIRLPTGFSPNGDGINDNYVIPGLDQHTENDFRVFNRWGNLVYNKKNYNNEWYGQNNAGEPLVDGTYFVIFESTRGLTLNSYVDLRR